MKERIEIPSDLDALDTALDWALARVPAWADRDAVELGLTEALTNAITHGSVPARDSADDAAGSSRPCKAVELELENKDGSLWVGVHWFGTPWHVCDRNRSLPDDHMSERGRGLMLMVHIFDRVSWSNDGFMLELQLFDKDTTSQ